MIHSHFRIRNVMLLTLLAYVISNGLSLTYPNTLFWDDWLFYTDTPIDFSESGTRDWCCWPRDIIETELLEIWPGSFRLLTFFIYPLVAILAREIAKPLLGYGLNRTELNYFTVLVLLLPLNSARVATITFQWSLALLVFCVASLIWTRCNSILPLVLAIILFLFSFRMSSLLAFVLVPSIVAFAVEKILKNSSSLRAILKLLTPMGSAVTYWYLISDNGTTTGYNEFQLTGIVKSIFFLLFIVLVTALLRIFQPQLKLKTRAINQLAIGLLILWLGAFPYMTVGHLSSLGDWTSSLAPGVSDWNSRHQILLSFGLAISLIGFWNLLEGNAVRILLPITVSLSLLLTTLYSIEYYIDSKKQSAVERVLEESLQGQDDKFVYLIDDPSAGRLNARGRAIREYEFDGLLKKSLGSNAPKFLDEKYLATTVCDDPTSIRVLRFSYSTRSFSKVRLLFGGNPRIDVAESSTMVCLKQEELD